MQSYVETKYSYATGCLICGEGVPIYSPSERGCYKICDKCKKAVMYIREQLYNDHVKVKEKTK